MKRILFTLSILLTLSGVKLHSQTLDVTYKSYSGGSIAVIKPTIPNFVTLLSLTESEFERKMKQYNYYEDDKPGKYRSFSNGSITNFMYTKCVNTYLYNIMKNEIRFFVSIDMIYPSDAISLLYRELKPYFVDSKLNTNGNSVDYFAVKYENSVYDFFVTNTGTMYDVTIQGSTRNTTSITVSHSYGSSSTTQSSSQNSSATLSISYPKVKITGDSDTKIKKVSVTSSYTSIEIECTNTWANGWCNIDPDTYILVNGTTRYKMRRAEGIKIAPEKTNFAYQGQKISFTLFFQPIPTSTTSIDLIESAKSVWQWYGIKLRDD